MKFFLKIKAWQLFLLLFVLPFGLQCCLLPIVVWSGSTAAMFALMLIVQLISVAVFMEWFWTLGTQLNNNVPEEIRMKSQFFRFGIAYSVIYMLCFLVFFIVSAATDIAAHGLFAIIIPFHLFAMFCMFYALYFVSKNLVMAERKQAVGFSDFAGPFFLIWFYPIGVWFIQPGINRMFQHESDA